MTIDEFNAKWKAHLETDFYGLALSTPSIVSYVDSAFEKLKTNRPNFTYSQIKSKFNSARVYLGPANDELIQQFAYEMELEIKKLMNGHS